MTTNSSNITMGNHALLNAKMWVLAKWAKASWRPCKLWSCSYELHTESDSARHVRCTPKDVEAKFKMQRTELALWSRGLRATLHTGISCECWFESWLLVNVPGEAAEDIPVLTSLSPMWEITVEFQTSRLVMVQPWPLRPFGEWCSNQEVSLSHFVISSLSHCAFSDK